MGCGFVPMSVLSCWQFLLNCEQFVRNLFKKLNLRPTSMSTMLWVDRLTHDILYTLTTHT